MDYSKVKSQIQKARENNGEAPHLQAFDLRMRRQRLKEEKVFLKVTLGQSGGG